MGRKKYTTEEEKKAANREACRRYYERNKEKKKEYKKHYYEDHKKEYSEYHKLYVEEHKEELKEYQKQYQERRKEDIQKYRKEYYKKNREREIEKHRLWTYTKYGRAANLLAGYISSDKIYKRGKGDLTAQWILDNILSKPCAHCGLEDWTKIGCNRLDNSKPHTKDNVEPCCTECNKKLPRR